MVSSSPKAPRDLPLQGKLLGWARKLAYTALTIVLAVYLSAAFGSRAKPDLALWHTISLGSEFRADHALPDTNFSDYLDREAQVFEELQREIVENVGESPGSQLNRFVDGSRVNPRHLATNWNRSYQLAPASKPPDPSNADPANTQGNWPRGAALLIHGLSDSPYSLRRVGEILQDEGYHVVGLRLPGHGTNPGSLATVSWQDWRAAVQIAARHTAKLAGEGTFLVVGYSAGGALSVDYAIDSITNEDLPSPQRLVLFSPAIGITRFAALASWHKALSWLDYFEKFSWTDIEPEYDPFKYNSFPLNGGEQMHLLALGVQQRLRDLDRAGRMDEIPEILAFQSLVDSTVLTDAIVQDLFDDLERSGSELVLFDLNRVGAMRPFLSSNHTDLLEQVGANSDRRYVATLIANTEETTLSVSAFSYPAGSVEGSEKTTLPLALKWPVGVYSLSHVALPFAPDDPIYGQIPPASRLGPLHLGTLAPRGEKGLLRVSMSSLMRLRYNPFFAYVEDRLRAWVD